MKKIFTILLTSLTLMLVPATTNSHSYNSNYNKVSNYNIKSYEVVDYIGWQLSNHGCYGCSSFYYKVTKSKYPTKDGRYIYDFWFYSNSYYINGQWASTYVYGIFIQVDGQYLNQQPFWVTFKETANPTMMRFTTTNPNPYVFIKWNGHKLL